MSNPYQDLPADRFWRTGVAELQPLAISGLWKPKFRIKRRTPIVTAGSCFAQHFSRALVARGYRWGNHEPGPDWLTDAQRHDFHYGTFSFRTGNIYTPRMLRQWLSWAFGLETTPLEVWKNGDRFYDPFRPGVEPGGFENVDELHASRAATLEAIRQAVETTRIFVFTLGLTEAWQNKQTNVEYAVCPGTIAGAFDPKTHGFVNHKFATLTDDLTASLEIMRAANSAINLLLTVSPVPLTATASGHHVLTATSHSKSLLRAVASEFSDGRANVDYFPSYEIITHPAYKGMFFEPNQRSVKPEGVAHVMQSFFNDHDVMFSPKQRPEAGDLPGDAADAMKIEEDNLSESEVPDHPHGATEMPDTADDLRCEEEILAAFGPK